MSGGFPFEATGNLDEWPKNQPGKPTQVAVFGVNPPGSGKTFEILFTAKFPDLEPAMYWAAKKEVEAVRKGKWMVASRVLWQHDLSPEEAVATIRRQMQPQLERMFQSLEAGEELDIGSGPMQAVDPNDAQGYYVELAKAGSDDPLASWVLPKEALEDFDPMDPIGPIGPNGPFPPPDSNIPPDPRDS